MVVGNKSSAALNKIRSGLMIGRVIAADYKPNGQPIPTVGIRWTPAPFLYNPRINP